jgi:hypothetical protein
MRVICTKCLVLTCHIKSIEADETQINHSISNVNAWQQGYEPKVLSVFEHHVMKAYRA